jgi:uncharacterized protein (DUF2267 family)
MTLAGLEPPPAGELRLVDYDGLVKLVEQATGADREEAERAVRAVVETLGERLGPREARDLAGTVPAELSAWLVAARAGQDFDLAEFVRRVAERERVEPPTAQHHATAVLSALGAAVHLPPGFAPIMPRAGYAEEFLLAVADRAHLDRFDAERIADAVLETLAEGIGARAAELLAVVPATLHPAVRRGQANPDPDLPVERFLARVASRAHVSPRRARDYVRAVLATVRDRGGADLILTRSGWADIIPGRPSIWSEGKEANHDRIVE